MALGVAGVAAAPLALGCIRDEGTMNDEPRLALNDGRELPQLGFGVWRVGADAAEAVVGQALAAGYRLVDTAAAYGNEEGVGRALRAAGRDGVFVTTKLWNGDHGYDRALRAFDASLGRLGLDAVDLYLIHWPCPGRALYVETWKALVRLRDDGRARSIGVSNFTPETLTRIVDATGVVPAVNQIELHPRFQQEPMRALDAELGIVTQSWSPLGRGHLDASPVLAEIARAHGKSWAQVVIRWHLQSGLAVIPKSVTPARIAANRDVFDFALTDAEMAAIAALDDPGGRGGSHPDDMNG
jgi:2,5-diketo-D-gluconate reductase A